ncbi:trypsin-like peptidase domain-containing protein [Streptomyces sp. NPDC002309]
MARPDRRTPPRGGAPGLGDDVLVRIHDLAGRPRGTGFVADHQGTVLTSHEAVDGLGRFLLRAGTRSRVVTAEAVTSLPERNLALVRAGDLDVRPLPVTARDRVATGTYVWIAAGRWRQARVLGAVAGVTYTATDRFRQLDDVLQLAIGTDGRDALRLGGGAAGGPVVDAATGAVVAVLGTALHTGQRDCGFAVPLRPAGGGPLTHVLARNAATVPAYGADLNLGGVLELGALSVGAGGAVGARARAVGDLPGTGAEPVERAGVIREFAAFTEGSAAVLGLVGAPGSGRTTELAALAARRGRGTVPAPTVWLRGADLRDGDESVAVAVGRVLSRAARGVTPADGEEVPDFAGIRDGAAGFAAAEGEASPGGGEAPLGDAGAGRLAALARAAGRPLLLLLDGPEEMPSGLDHRWGAWSEGTACWLRETGARLVVACRAEYWERAGAAFPEEILHPGGPACLPPCVPLGDLDEDEAREARVRHGIPEDALAAPDARHPLTLRLLSEVLAATPDALRSGPPDRNDVLTAHLDLMCLRVAVRLAGEDGGRRGTDVRRLAAKVAGRVHEAARRSLGPGQGELTREAFEEVFPCDPAPAGRGGDTGMGAGADSGTGVGVGLGAGADPGTGVGVGLGAGADSGTGVVIGAGAGADTGLGAGTCTGTGWASAVLSEGLFVHVGTGYRFAHEELADWIQGTHLDLDEALRALVHHHAPDPDDPDPVPHHRAGPVVQALLLLARQQGTHRLAVRLEEMVRALDVDPHSWWAARLLGETLRRVPDAQPYLRVLRLLAETIVERRRRGRAVPAEFGPAFWAEPALSGADRLDLLRRLLLADIAPAGGDRYLDAAAQLLAADPAAVQPHLVRWFDDERVLPAAPHATVATAAQALLHTHRHRAPDDLTEVLAEGAHPRGDELLGVLAEEEPAAVCRAVDRWAHDERPARRAAAVTHGLLVAPHVRADTDRELLRYAALALLARPADRALHGGALALLVQDPRTRARYLPRAVEHFGAGDPRMPASALATALVTHPEPVLDAFRTRLRRADAGEVLRALAEALFTGEALGTLAEAPFRGEARLFVPGGGRSPALVRRVAEVVREAVALRVEWAGPVAAQVDRRLDVGCGAVEGPAGGPRGGCTCAGGCCGARAVLFSLVTGVLDGGPEELRTALADVLGTPGAPASRALRREICDFLLVHEHAVPVLEALLRSAARHGGDELRALVHRTGMNLVRTPAGATRFDCALLDLGRAIPGFAARVAHWLNDAPEDWAAVVGPSTRRMIESLAGVRIPA